MQTPTVRVIAHGPLVHIVAVSCDERDQELHRRLMGRTPPYCFWRDTGQWESEIASAAMGQELAWLAGIGVQGGMGVMQGESTVELAGHGPDAAALADYEQQIEAALAIAEAVWIPIARCLQAIHDRRLYTAYGTWAEYCAERWGKTRDWGYKLMEAGRVVANVERVIHEGAPPLTLRQALALGREHTVLEVAIAGDSRDLQAGLEESPLAAHQLIHASASNEWYTPALYVEAARALMGGIDIDPASCAEANRFVQATIYYTRADDGFGKPWPGRVFLNPPYGLDDGESNQARWSARLLEQYRAGITREAILLVNAVTDRAWFKPLWDFPLCFTDHRIRFYNEHASADQPTHGNVFVYLGANIAAFAERFCVFGPIVRRVG